MAKNTSPKWNFSNWSFWIWLSKNKEVVKGMLAVILGLAFFQSGYGAIVSVVIGSIAKFVFDTADFFVSEVDA